MLASPDFLLPQPAHDMRTWETGDVPEAVRGGTSHDLPHAHARPILVHTPCAYFAGGGDRHATGGNADRGLWTVDAGNRLGLGTGGLRLVPGQRPREIGGISDPRLALVYIRVETCRMNN